VDVCPAKLLIKFLKTWKNRQKELEMRTKLVKMGLLGCLAMTMVPATLNGADCKPLIEACENALKAQDAQVEALKKAVKEARDEATNCYDKCKKSSDNGGWLVPLALGLASGVLLGVTLGR